MDGLDTRQPFFEFLIHLLDELVHLGPRHVVRPLGGAALEELVHAPLALAESGVANADPKTRKTVCLSREAPPCLRVETGKATVSALFFDGVRGGGAPRNQSNKEWAASIAAHTIDPCARDGHPHGPKPAMGSVALAL